MESGRSDPEGPGCTPRLLPAQQQDDLGAAFQTWMDTNGALRAEVPQEPCHVGFFPGGNRKNVWSLPHHVACTEPFTAPAGISQPQVGRAWLRLGVAGDTASHTASPRALFPPKPSRGVSVLAGPAPTAASHGSGHSLPGAGSWWPSHRAQPSPRPGVISTPGLQAEKALGAL